MIKNHQHNHHFNHQTIIGIIIETIIGIISTIITSVVKRSTHYLPVTQTSSQRPSHYERSVERVAATEPQTNRRDTRKQSGRPRACVERTATIRLSAASGTTVDRGRRRKET
jgi:hypothetical protein